MKSEVAFARPRGRRERAVRKTHLGNSRRDKGGESEVWEKRRTTRPSLEEKTVTLSSTKKKVARHRGVPRRLKKGGGEASEVNESELSAKGRDREISSPSAEKSESDTTLAERGKVHLMCNTPQRPNGTCQGRRDTKRRELFGIALRKNGRTRYEGREVHICRLLRQGKGGGRKCIFDPRRKMLDHPRWKTDKGGLLSKKQYRDNIGLTSADKKKRELAPQSLI